MFFLSLFLIMVGGVGLFYLCKLCHLPSLVGYLAFGILLGYFELIDSLILAISPQIRKIALLIILVKAALSLDIKKLKEVGRPAILMSFLPACVEMCAVGFFAPLLFPSLTYVDSFLLGSVLGAVSPAVVVPMMVKLMSEKYGTKKGIPELIVAGSSIDDIIMIVFYTAFLTIEGGNSISAMTFLNIPISIVSGVAVGLLFGFILSFIFKKAHIRDSFKLAIIFGLGFGLVFLEDYLSTWFGFSSLLAVITMALFLNKNNFIQAKRLSERCSKIWSLAEVFLFVLVGASIKIEYFSKYFLLAFALLAISLTFRACAVLISLIKTKFNKKEKSFIVLSYMPKATVQAAIGGGLLDFGNKMGDSRIIAAGIIVLSVSVVAILLSAPISSIIMNLSYKKLLTHDEEVIEPIATKESSISK